MRIRVFLKIQWYFNSWLCSHACMQCLRGEKLYLKASVFIVSISPFLIPFLLSPEGFRGLSWMVLNPLFSISFTKAPLDHGMCLHSESKWFIILWFVHFHLLGLTCGHSHLRKCLFWSLHMPQSVIIFSHLRAWIKCKLFLELFSNSFLEASRNNFPIYSWIYLYLSYWLK